MSVRGVRGAITIAGDQAELVRAGTRELLCAILQANPQMQPEDIASVFFTVTDDLTSAYPAQAARIYGWDLVPLMCAREIPVPGALPYCIRVLLLWNTEAPQDAVHHVYLGEAARLRPDLNKNLVEN